MCFRFHELLFGVCIETATANKFKRKIQCQRSRNHCKLSQFSLVLNLQFQLGLMIIVLRPILTEVSFVVFSFNAIWKRKMFTYLIKQ